MKKKSEINNIAPLVSMKKLEFILGVKRERLKDVASKANHFYKPFKKITKNKSRYIDNPTGDLKYIQSKIHKNILKNILFPKEMVGGIKSTKENTKPHIGKEVVVTIDIKNCFKNIKDKTIFKIFKDNLKCSTGIASLLTRLTTYKTYLPEGAPTSTLLANLSLINMFEDIKKIVKKNKIEVTIYVDDITFSGINPDRFISKFIKIIRGYGYSVRAKKINVMPSNKRQEVTGTVVNRKRSASKERIKDCKNIIFELRKKEIKINKKALDSILGKIQFIRNNQNPKQAKELINLVIRYLPLEKKEKARIKKIGDR